MDIGNRLKQSHTISRLLFWISIFSVSSVFAQQPEELLPPPPPTAQTQAQQASPPEPTPPPAPVAGQVPQQMSSSQFQQWLQSNGYTQNQSNGATVVQAPVATRVVNRPPTNIPPPPRKKRPRVTCRPLTYEEQQSIMVQSMPRSRIPAQPDNNVAFNSMLQQNMPLTPQQVVRLHQQIDLSQLAASTPPNIPPKPVSSTLMINLAPGVTPPAVRLAQGYVSSLVFVDSTGQPWPISAFDIGNPKAVNIQWDGKSNILLLQAVSPYSNGDIVIRLVGLPTPITLELVSGQRVVDYRVDIHVSGLGPNTKELPIGTALPLSANQLLLGVLDGIGPAGSKILMVHGADSQAWLLGEVMYLRTRLTVLSPGWVGTMVSPDGMHAYELPKTSSVLVSRYGEPIELKIEGF